jgi:hypothetical protein
VTTKAPADNDVVGWGRLYSKTCVVSSINLVNHDSICDNQISFHRFTSHTSVRKPKGKESR